MAKHRLWEFVSGYENGSDTILGKSFTQKRISGRITGNMHRRRDSGAHRLWSEIVHRISYISSKAYGAMSLSFGLVTIILSFLEDYGSATGEAATLSFIIGVGFALLAIPLLLFDEPLSLLLQNARISDFILFDFLCINRVARVKNPRSVHTVLMAVVGVLLALIGYFVPAVWVAVGFFALVLFVLSLSSPEFGLISTLLSLPLISLLPFGTAVLTAMVSVTLISFIRKVISGKRVMVLEQYDILMLILAGAVAISGVFNGGIQSFLEATISVAAFFGYVLAGNMITGRRLADNALGAVAVSSFPVFSVSVYQLIYGTVSYGFLPTLDAGVSSVFPDTGVCAVFLTVSILAASALAKQAKGSVRAAWCILAVLYSLALLMTGEMFAWLALLLSVSVYFALRVRVWSALIIPLMALVPYIIILLPVSSLPWIDNTSNAALMSVIHELWRVCGIVFKNNAFLGVGMGKQSFIAAVGGGVITNAQNLFIEIALEAGAVALIAMLLILAVGLRHRVEYRKYIRHSQVSVSSTVMACAVFAVITYGAVNYVWSDMSACFLFWCVFGISAATLRIAKTEHDDRVLYYDDIRSYRSSSVDVSLD